MKKAMRAGLLRLMTVTVIVCMLLNVISSSISKCARMRETSSELFYKISQTLSENEKEIAEIKEEYARTCLLQADAAAYFLMHNPGLLNDQDEIKKVCNLLQLEELHFFTPDGTLFAGSNPEYFGYTFNSGKQMSFFLPMLSDKTLRLCQEAGPNTAEGKNMQYAAVWLEDGSYIVQVGSSPKREFELMRKNEISYIFSMMTPEDGYILYAVDPDTMKICGTTEQPLIGKTIYAAGVGSGVFHPDGNGFTCTIGGKRVYCYFEQVGDMLLGRSVELSVLYAGQLQSGLVMLIFLLLLACVLMVCVMSYLDRTVIQSISQVNRTLSQIAGGDLTEKVEVDSTPEFAQLSAYINWMVDGLLSSSDRLSYVLDQVDIPIGAYEYTADSERVTVTRRVAQILCLEKAEAERLFSNRALFVGFIAGIRQNQVAVGADAGSEKKNVYQIPGHERYVQLESFIHGSSVFGSVIDVTAEMVEKRGLIRERDEDILTGLLNRRAFVQKLSALMNEPEKLGHAALMMIDTDDLKEMNDRFGHLCGDRYLREIASILSRCPAEKKLAARFGGDEFILLVYGYGSAGEAQAQAVRMRAEHEQFPFDAGSQIITTAFSLGFVLIPEEGENLTELFAEVDKRMYLEKKKHKEKKAGKG